MKTFVLVLALMDGTYAEHPEPLDRAECLSWALNITNTIADGQPVEIFTGSSSVEFAFCHKLGAEPTGSRRIAA